MPTYKNIYYVMKYRYLVDNLYIAYLLDKDKNDIIMTKKQHYLLFLIGNAIFKRYKLIEHDAELSYFISKLNTVFFNAKIIN